VGETVAHYPRFKCGPGALFSSWLHPVVGLEATFRSKSGEWLPGKEAAWGEISGTGAWLPESEDAPGNKFRSTFLPTVRDIA
jgi:hypothetical protein